MSASRAKYIAAERKKLADKGEKDAFGSAVVKSIRAQAAKKNFTFKK